MPPFDVPHKRPPPRVDKRLPASVRIRVALRAFAGPDGVVRVDTDRLAAAAGVPDVVLLACLDQCLCGGDMSVSFIPDHPSRVLVVLNPLGDVR